MSSCRTLATDVAPPPAAPRVLIVEDDPDQRQLICDALRLYFQERSSVRGVPTAGATLVGVGSARECLRQDLAGFDVVLMDYHLPDATGLALLEQVHRVCDVPVVFVTGENVATTAAEALRRGAQDYVVKLGDYLFALPVVVEKNIRQHHLERENARLRAELSARLDEIRVQNLRLEESLRKVQDLAATDHLTGLANRRTFAAMLERLFGEARRYDFDLACLMGDLDHYKHFNDTFGHQAGDRILVVAADVIRSNLRSSDLAARYGGDEFVLLLPHTGVDTAHTVAERIRQQLAAATRAAAQEGRPVTLSVGISALKSDGPESADALVAMADKALYLAKDSGKNRVVTHAHIGALTAAL